MTTKTNSTPVKIFFCYARKDRALRDKLENHLEPLRRSGQVITWHDREIQAGKEWKKEIDIHLNSSNIVLLLVSSHFMSSDYCYSIEMQHALDRHRAGEAYVIPIILSPVQWKETPIAELQALPRDGKPITLWRNRDSAFKNVTEEIFSVIETLFDRPLQQTDSAKLTVELTSSYQQASEKQVGISFQVTNIGNDTADNVFIILEESDNFEIIGSIEHRLKTISPLQTALVHFMLKPSTSDNFSIQTTSTYTDVNKLKRIIKDTHRPDLKKSYHAFRVIPNWYSPGIPIREEEMFYGREADIALLSRLLISSVTTNMNRVVMLIGARRSGKTSLIYQLEKRLNPHIPVHLDLQKLALSKDTNDFLMEIIGAIHGTLEERGINLRYLDEQVTNNNPGQQLDCYLEFIMQKLNGERLILLLDEFEVVDLMIQQERLNLNFLEYLRSLMLHGSGISLLLAGNPYLLDNALKDRSGLFNLAHLHKISKLERDEAERLIMEPVRKLLTYDTPALERIHNLTGDLPYLIQIFGEVMIQFCNQNRKPYVTSIDVNNVLEIVLDYSQHYLNMMWSLASTPNQHLLLALMARGADREEREPSFSLINLKTMFSEHDIPFRQDRIQKALDHLVEEEIVEKSNKEGLYTIPVGLMRAWLRENKPAERIMAEEFFEREND